MDLRGGQGSGGGARRTRPRRTRRPAADQILADLQDPICRWRVDSTLLFVNDAYCRLHGRAADQLIGHRLFDLVAGAPAADAAESLIRRVLTSLRPSTPTYAYEHAHAYAGGAQWMQWTNRGLFDEHGRLVEVQSIGRDITEYKVAVQHWRDSEARYRLLAEHSRDPIARLALDGTCVYMSPAFRLMTGFDADEIVGVNPASHCHPDDWPAVAAVGDTLPDHPDGVVLTYRTRHRTRGWVWVESTIRPVRDADGAVVEFILVARDVEARQAAEAALRESEQRLDLALAAADMGLWDWDLDRQAIMHDARWAAQLGYRPDEVHPLPQPWHRMLHPDDRREVAERLRAHLEGETEMYVSEHRLRARNGAWRWVLACGRVVSRMADGRPRRMVGLQRDISDRVRVDEALRASEAQLRAVIENVPDFVSVVGLDGIITYINRSAPQIDKSSIVGRPFTAFADAADRDGLQHCFDQAVASGAMQMVELRGMAPDGAPKWFVARMVPIVRAGAVCGVTLITSEVTTQHEREDTLRRFNAELEARVNARTAELQASLRELESFSYSVSHDLRAPLRAIDGFSQALAEDYAGRLDAQGLEFLTRVRNAAQRMGELIDDLLGLARVMRKDLAVGPIRIGALAREVANELERGDASRAGAFHIDESLVANADPVLLRAALANLLGNAWKFTRRRADACIEFGIDQRNGGEAVFYVRDNGVGFDMAYVAKLFRPFQRLHEPGEFEGTGIGLATVQRIISRHGGWIWAESAPNAGATFYFTLPAA
ncbi:MAG: PAS domain S-box protein [Deltaproteobacteria bacterium]|nr:PAS domain S-box protein [Deltaproteobacteria bacterium]